MDNQDLASSQIDTGNGQSAAIKASAFLHGTLSILLLLAIIGALIAGTIILTIPTAEASMLSATNEISGNREPASTTVPVLGALSQEQARFRVEHSQELLGKHYSRSKVRIGETVPKINSQIYRWTRERLVSDFKKDHAKIAQAIIDESLKYGFDPVFLLSIIQTESRFNPLATGTSGEIGLMQILPATAEWIAGKAKIEWTGKNSLRNPVTNIQIGAAYLAYLRDRFDMHAQLYIAAYNMGQRNVDSAQARKIWPKDYPGLVMKNYVEFYQELSESRLPAARQASI